MNNKQPFTFTFKGLGTDTYRLNYIMRVAKAYPLHHYINKSYHNRSKKTNKTH